MIACLAVLSLSACASRNADVTGTWLIEQAMGVNVDNTEEEAFMTFDKKGNIMGNTGVNAFAGYYYVKDKKMILKDLFAMTGMLAENMEIEDAVTGALNDAASITVEGDKAELVNAYGETVMTVRRVEQ